MNKSVIIFTFLLVTQLLQVYAGGGLKFDVNKSYAYLNAGDCYLYPGVSSSNNRIGYQYYDLPYGWRQHQGYVVVPNLLSQKGNWNFGLRASDAKDSSVNERFKVSVDGLQLQLAPVTQTSSPRNLVIGSNYRTEGVSDKSYNNFINSLFNDDNTWDDGFYLSDGFDWSDGAWASLRGNGKGTGSGSGRGSGSGSGLGLGGLTGIIGGTTGSGPSTTSSTVVGPNGRTTTTTTTYTTSSSSSGSSSGSIPFSGSLTGGSSSIDSLINNLLNRYNTDDDRERRYTYTTTSTPSEVYVTSSSRFNTDDRRNALDRQYNANRALNDLNVLISQLTSNVDATTATISSIQSQLSGYKTTSSQCNDKILQYNSAKLKAETSINSLREQINSARTRLNDLQPALNALISKRNQLVQQRISIERSRTPSSSIIAQLQDRYTSCNANVDTLKADYSKAEATIRTSTDQITTIRSSVADAPNQIQLVDQQISIVDGTIADLETKLREARTQRNKLVDDKARYNSLLRDSNNQISSIERDVSRFRAQLPGIQGRIDARILECTSYKDKGDKLKIEIASKQSDYDQIVKQIDVQEGLISSKQNQINALISDTNALPAKSRPFEADLDSTRVALERQYYICNQASSTVTRSENDLRAANLKLETEKKFLSDAQAKLTAARTEKQNADDAVNKILNDISKVTGTTGGSTGGSTTTITTTTGGSGVSFPSIGTIGTGITLPSIGSGLFPSTGSTGSGSFTVGTGTTGSTIISGPTGGINSIISGILNGGSGTLGGSTSGSFPSNVLVYGVGPISIGSIGDYIEKIYGPSMKTFWNPYSTGSTSTFSTMYPISSTTLGALYGTNSAGVFLPKDNTFLSGISANQIGSSSLPSNILGDFTCSSGSSSSFGSGSGVTSGFGKITSIQPGYITIQSDSGNVNLRVGGCSRLEANKPDFVASILDPVFYRGKRGLNNDVHLYDLTCLS